MGWEIRIAPRGTANVQAATYRRAARTFVAVAAMLTMLLSGCGGVGSGPRDATSGVLLVRADGPVATSGEADTHVLDGATVRGSVMVFVESHEVIDEVTYRLDAVGGVVAVRGLAPFAFELDTTSLDDGSYTLSALSARSGSSGGRLVAEARFSVRNRGVGGGEDGPFAPSDPLPDAGSPAGPIVITSGGHYSGHWQSLDSNVPAVTIRTSEPVVIENAVIRSAGHLISAPWVDAHVTIVNVHGEALYPSVAGRSAGRFASIEGYRYVRIEHSSMVGTSGIYLNQSHPGATVHISYNHAWNIDGRRSDGSGGYRGYDLVQFVQLNRANALVASHIGWNKVINEPGHSRVEDVISTYRSSASPSSPLRIHDNYIQGAYPANPATDGYSGGGIILGDLGGSFLQAVRNHVVSTSNYGVAIAGGHDNRLEGNRVVSCGRLSDGTPIAAHNVGVYIWNQYDVPAFNNVGHANEIGWVHASGQRNDWWIPSADEWSGNVAFGAVSCDDERAEYLHWSNRAASAGISVGPTYTLSSSTVAASLD